MMAALLNDMTLFIFTVIIAKSSFSRANPSVELQVGTLLGNAVEFNKVGIHRTVHVYKGIPFAEPPIRDRRFLAPERKRQWQGEWDATYYRAACVQNTGKNLDLITITESTDEDCLYLNVFTSQTQSGPVAVMVWFHGGGLLSGSASMPYYNGVPLSAIADVIVVTVNYRLGALGFLSTGDDVVPGNAGMFDQLLALEWVKENIAVFGGDPQRVTIFGQSSGSVSVGFHLMSPLSTGLFHKAIMQSGSPTSSWTVIHDKDVANKRAHALGEVLGCDRKSSKELVTCLQTVPAEKFIGPSLDMNLISEITGEAYTLFPFIVNVDGIFLRENVRTTLNEQTFKKCDIMLGSTKDEGTFILYLFFPHMRTMSEVLVDEQTFDAVYPSVVFTVKGNDLLKDIAQFQYTNWENINFAETLNQLYTDEAVSCPTSEMAHAYSNANQNVYLYYLTHHPSKSIYENVTWMKASHGEELQYVFGFVFMDDMNWSVTDDEVKMTLQIMRYWANFAKTGNPNTPAYETENSDENKATIWPSYAIPGRNFKKLSPEMLNGKAFKLKECVFWNQLVPKVKEYTEPTPRPRDHEKAKYSEGCNKP